MVVNLNDNQLLHFKATQKATIQVITDIASRTNPLTKLIKVEIITMNKNVKSSQLNEESPKLFKVI